jgi:hypothetical protein
MVYLLYFERGLDLGDVLLNVLLQCGHVDGLADLSRHDFCLPHRSSYEGVTDVDQKDSIELSILTLEISHLSNSSRESFGEILLDLDLGSLGTSQNGSRASRRVQTHLTRIPARTPPSIQ